MLIIASPLSVVRKFTWNNFLRSVSLASISASSAGMSSLIFALPMGNCGTSIGVFGSSLSNIARYDLSPSCHTLNSARMRKCVRADSNTSVSGKGTSEIASDAEEEEDAAKCARARSIFASSSSRYVSGRTATSSRARVVCHCQWFLLEPRRGRAGAEKRRRTQPPQSAAAGFAEPEKNRAVDARSVAARTCTCARIVSADPLTGATRRYRCTVQTAVRSARWGSRRKPQLNRTADDFTDFFRRETKVGTRLSVPVAMRAGFLDARPSRRKQPDPSSVSVAASPRATSWRTRAPQATHAFLDAACAEFWTHGHEVVFPPEASASPSENLLLLLHGRGERSAAPFAAFARKISLPHTTCLSLAGPLPLPFGVPGREWFARLDPETGQDLPSRPGDRRRAESLLHTRKALDALLDRLTDVASGGWPNARVHVFGFSDGGTVALETSAKRVGAARRLGGCATVAAAMLPERVADAANAFPPSPRAPTPVALTCGDGDEVVTRASVEETARTLRARNPGAVADVFVGAGKKTHAMVSGEAETRFLMRFWSRTLGVPATRAEDLGTDVVEVETNGGVDVVRVTSSERTRGTV